MHYDHILGATDFSELGDIALRRAADLAISGDAKLTCLHVLPTPSAPNPIFASYDISPPKERIEEAKAKAREMLEARVPAEVRETDLEIAYEIRVGDPASEILSAEASCKPDLIVLATHGYRGWRRWVMGSVAERVVQMAHADVLAIRERHEDYADDAADDAG